MFLPRQRLRLVRAIKNKERAMAELSHTAIAVVGIDIGKNSFYSVGFDQRRSIVLCQKCRAARCRAARWRTASATNTPLACRLDSN